MYPFRKEEVHSFFYFVTFVKMQTTLVIIIVTAAVYLAVRRCIKRPANGCGEGCEECNPACSGCKLKKNCRRKGKELS